MPTDKQNRDFIIAESFTKHQALRNTIEKNIGELYDLKPSVAHAYLYALDTIFSRYGDDREKMSDAGLIVLVSVNRR